MPLVPVHETQLYVDDRGSGFPVFVLHGGPGLDHTLFGDHLDALTDSYRLLLVDEREQGRSDRGTDPATWTLSQHASDVSGLAAMLGIEHYAVLGHSFGALIALQHAADAPGAAVATVVSSGVPSSRYFEEVDKGLATFEPEELRAQVTRSWEREATAQTPEEVKQLLIDQLPWHFADPRDPRIAALTFADMVCSPAPLRAGSLEGDGLRIEVEERLTHVHQPVLVLTGRHDRTCVPAASERIAELVPHAELHVFERSGHLAFIEEPEAYVATVRAFLDRVTR
ncbi:MAG: alpha/beta fold hydrolase [Mycobacteriales bacterium]